MVAMVVGSDILANVLRRHEMSAAKVTGLIDWLMDQSINGITFRTLLTELALGLDDELQQLSAEIQDLELSCAMAQSTSMLPELSNELETKRKELERALNAKYNDLRPFVMELVRLEFIGIVPKYPVIYVIPGPAYLGR